VPAISVNLIQLPDEASGYAVIGIQNKSDIQGLKHPRDLQLHWG